VRSTRPRDQTAATSSRGSCASRARHRENNVGGGAEGRALDKIAIACARSAVVSRGLREGRGRTAWDSITRSGARLPASPSGSSAFSISPSGSIQRRRDILPISGSLPPSLSLSLSLSFGSPAYGINSSEMKRSVSLYLSTWFRGRARAPRTSDESFLDVPLFLSFCSASLGERVNRLSFSSSTPLPRSFLLAAHRPLRAVCEKREDYV
jgi:hypothetical protein